MDFNSEIVLACDSGIKELEAIRDYTHRLQGTENDDMKQVYTNNRADELPHIQNLVIAITQMVNGEEPKEAAQMDDTDDTDAAQPENTDRADAKKIKGDRLLIVDCWDQDGSLQSLLEYIRDNASSGHSFSIVVDPGDPEREKMFGIDGDGTDHIYDIAVEMKDAEGGDKDDES